MLRRLAKHAATILITVLLGGFLAATLVRFAPGFGVDDAELDARRSRESIQAIRQANGMNESLPVFYVHYLSAMTHGDLGMSRTLERPVAELIRERLPETMKSIALGIAVAWSFGLGLAIPIAMWRSVAFDYVASLLAGLLLCVPAAVLALMFLLTRAPARLAIALIVFPTIFRYSRNLLKRSAALPHVLAARARGLADLRILCWHVLPPAWRQLLALAGISVSIAFGAAIPVEVLCDVPGIGQLAWKAALGRDLYLLVFLTMIVTIITTLANSTADLLSLRRVEA